MSTTPQPLPPGWGLVSEDQADDSRRGLSPQMTLPQFYEAFVRPVCHEAKERQPETLRAYRGSLKLWAEITRNPPLQQIDDFTCARFVTVLRDRPGLRGAPKLSPNSVIKHCVHLQFCLDRAGPRSRLNRLGQGLIDTVPYLERPNRRHKIPRDRFTLDEMADWLDALPRSMGPVDAARWWRALIVFCYNSALRIGSVMGAEWDGIKGEWLTLPAAAVKGGNRELEVYLNQPARDALELVAGSRRGRIFDWPGWPKSNGWLHELRRRQLVEARLPPERQLGFHGLRKACLNWLAARNELVARKVAGQVGGDVLRDHYCFDVMIDLLERLPQPGPIRQRTFW